MGSKSTILTVGQVISAEQKPEHTTLEGGCSDFDVAVYFSGRNPGWQQSHAAFTGGDGGRATTQPYNSATASLSPSSIISVLDGRDCMSCSRLSPHPVASPAASNQTTTPFPRAGNRGSSRLERFGGAAVSEKQWKVP